MAASAGAQVCLPFAHPNCNQAHSYQRIMFNCLTGLLSASSSRRSMASVRSQLSRLPARLNNFLGSDSLPTTKTIFHSRSGHQGTSPGDQRLLPPSASLTPLPTHRLVGLPLPRRASLATHLPYHPSSTLALPSSRRATIAPNKLPAFGLPTTGAAKRHNAGRTRHESVGARAFALLRSAARRTRLRCSAGSGRGCEGRERERGGRER